MKPQATVFGRLTRDVTSIFKNDDGTAKRALFTVACNSVYKRDNEKVKTTDFIPCIAWGPHADLLQEWGLKGRQILIKGTIETFQKPADNDGNYEPVKIQIRVAQMEFTGFEDNVREKYEAKKVATGTATPAGTEAILAQLATLIAGKAAPVAAPEPVKPAGTEAILAQLAAMLGTKTTPVVAPEPATATPPNAEALAAALLGVINQQDAPVETPQCTPAATVAEELSGLV